MSKTAKTCGLFAALATAAGSALLAIGAAWPLWLAYLASINAVELGLYGLDKLTARREAWRVPESVLHVFALLGGTPGALVGQMVFRHKTGKKSFRRVFWAIVALQVVVLAAAWYASVR